MLVGIDDEIKTIDNAVEKNPCLVVLSCTERGAGNGLTASARSDDDRAIAPYAALSIPGCPESPVWPDTPLASSGKTAGQFGAPIG